MKKYLLNSIFIMLLTLTFSLSKEVHAQDAYIAGSYWNMNDSDAVMGGVVGLAVPMILDNIKLDAKIYFFEDTEFESSNIELLPIDLGLQIHFSDEANLNPYVLAGVSFMYADADDIDVDSTFGGYAGGGLEYKIGEIRLFGELQYRIASVDKDTNVLEDDLDFNGMLVNAGLKVRF
jgi:opacity protein-like surface antigen